MTSTQAPNAHISMTLSQQSSFTAETTPITVVPAFSFPSPLPLLSSPSTTATSKSKSASASSSTTSVGPFVAGMPLTVPLWMAKVLQQKQLATLQLPDWLSLDRLVDILEQEKNSHTFTEQLPFYYYEIARALASETPQAVSVALHDVVQIRMDKLRLNFHAMSRENLVASEGPTPLTIVSGIGSVELTRMGPFLQQAFTDHGYLAAPMHHQQYQTTSSSEQDHGVATMNNSAKKNAELMANHHHQTPTQASIHGSSSLTTGSTSSKIVQSLPGLHSRLRRFRPSHSSTSTPAAN